MTKFYIGVLSGTSMDAIDAIVVDFNNTTPTIVAKYSKKLPSTYKNKYLQLITNRGATFDELGDLDNWTGELFASAIENLLIENSIVAQDIIAIGSHGQTIWHAPKSIRPFSLQLGNPHIIAKQTGIKTVADFRRTDMAYGGQGAPLAPAVHQALFAHPTIIRCIVNIGGFSNISILNGDNYLGYDTGPGNCLLDYWVKLNFNLEFDQDGALAASGNINDELLKIFLADEYFAQPAPKSTGREYFNPDWLNNKLSQVTQDISKLDVLATLLELTAFTISQEIKRNAHHSCETYICGGGARNLALLNRLSINLEKPVNSTASLGIDPQWIEAILFAWLAQQTVAGKSLHLQKITGASNPAILGAIYQA